MKYRALDATGDYTFGRGNSNFLVDSPEAVAQAIKTRLLLARQEWFLNTEAGTPYKSEILGADKVKSYDFAIQQVILNTTGVKSLADYSSKVDPATRKAYVSATVDTIYGVASVQTSL